MKERRKKENRKKQTKAEKNKGRGAEAIVGGWELNDFVVHLS